MKHEVQIPIDDRSLQLETGRIAKQADGSCVVRFGDTVVLATACAMREPKEGIDFLPLTVDYRENTYAAGRIPGGFFKREGRPTEKEILTSRLIDRPLRPLFPKGYGNETQIIAFVLSADGQNDPDILAINGASAALAVSGIPFTNTIGAVRVGRIAGKLTLNPTNKQREESEIDLIVAGTKDAVVMVEAGAREVPESVMIDAIFFGHEAIQKVIRGIEDLASRTGVSKPAFSLPEPYTKEFFQSIYKRWEGAMLAALTVPGRFFPTRGSRTSRRKPSPRFPRTTRRSGPGRPARWTTSSRSSPARRFSTRNERLDGRNFKQIRPITAEVGAAAAHPRLGALHPRRDAGARHVHAGDLRRHAASSRTTRASWRKTFMLHYNFPPFSVGEVKLMRGPGRREIGHGALAERALWSRPAGRRDRSPTRSASCRTSSNPTARSSMATICGGTLCAHGRGRPDQGAGRGSRDGPGQGRRPVRDPLRHRRARRTTTATWTSRWPARTTASPRSRWTSRSRG